VIASPPQTITWAIPLVPIVIGERLATTLSDGNMQPAGLADARLLAMECPEPVTAGVEHAPRAASAARRTGSSRSTTDRRSPVIGSQTVIVSPPEPITWAVPLVSIMIGERLATTLSGVYMPFRRSPS
jgi:hypothetical protein